MKAHLCFPYLWVDCEEPDNCSEGVHLLESAEELNNYPREWVENMLGFCVVTDSAVRFYDQKRNLHREDGPAVVHADGKQEWWLNGQKHRVGGPAVTERNGSTYWFNQGECHRVDGPAVTYVDSKNQLRGMYYVHGDFIKDTALAVPRDKSSRSLFSIFTKHKF